MNDYLLCITLKPNEQKLLPELDYSGSLLLRWQILNTAQGVDPLALVAKVEARQIITPIGHLSRGSWTLPAGDQLNAPLLDLSYSPVFEWKITTPSGFRGSQLLVYPHSQPVYQIPNDFQTMNISLPPTPQQSSNAGSSSVVIPTASSSTLVPANNIRMECLLVNNTNRTIWLVFGPGPATTASPSLSIPPGGNIDTPAGYVGPIVGIVGNTNGLTGSVVVTEFNAQQ
jgi:hypothetical protein